MNQQEEEQLLTRIRETAKQDAAAAVELIMQQIQWATPWREGQPHVLCFNRLRFALDVEQLQKSGRLNYSTLDNGLFNALLDSVTEPHLDDQELLQSFYPANQSPHILQHKAHCARLAELLISHINAVRPVQALLFANMDYRQNWPLEEVCAPRGIKTLCLSREHYVSEYLRSRKKRIFRDSGFKYRGDGIALFGDCSVPVFTDPGVCPQDKLFVTGAPRMDVWRNPPDEAPRKYPHMTLLSFSGGMYNASKSYPEALAVFAKISRHWWYGRGKKFIVKCKSTAERNSVHRLLEKMPGNKIHIKLGEIFEVLRHSRLVVGINSLALIEALLSDAVVAVPFWGDARQTPEQMVMSPADELVRRCVTFCESPAELEKLVKRVAAGLPPKLSQQQRAERMELFRRYFYFPEEKTCTQCVEEFIISCLQG